MSAGEIVFVHGDDGWSHREGDTLVSVINKPGFVDLSIIVFDGGYTLPCEYGDPCLCFPNGGEPESADDCTHKESEEEEQGTTVMVAFSSLQEMRAHFDLIITNGTDGIADDHQVDWSDAARKMTRMAWRLDGELLLPNC